MRSSLRADYGGADAWAMAFFRAMLSESLSTEDFETAVRWRWQNRDFVSHAPATAAWLHDLATGGAWKEAGYAHAEPELGFRSNFMVGALGRPGAVYIEAPPEAIGCAGLNSLNRPLHQHDSGRIAVITGGTAVFHVISELGGEVMMIDCAVEAGDVICWPAWTPHTFDARSGFTLITAMASYVSPAADGFIFPVDQNLIERPRRVYADLQAI